MVNKINSGISVHLHCSLAGEKLSGLWATPGQCLKGITCLAWHEKALSDEEKERLWEISEREEEWLVALGAFQPDCNFQRRKIWPSMGGKEKQIFMGGFTMSKILGVDKVPCGWEKSRREKSLGFIWGLVSLSTSRESLKGPSRRVEENSDRGQPDIHHLCCFRARQCTLQRKPLKESCVCWCARAKRLQLCTILSMSQRLRSLKITRRDRCGLRLIFFFFFTPLFLWLGVSRISLVYRRWLSCLGFLMVPWPIEPPIQTPCEAAAKESTQCLFVVCSHKHGSIFIWAQCHSLGKASFWFCIHELK